MKEPDALKMLSALGQSIRLRVLTTLAQAGSDGMASSDLADLVGVPRNLMSAHLAVLSKATLVTSRKSGRSVVYVIHRNALIGLGNHLTALAARGNGTGKTGST
ncbi:ArsR/SmtB family transcription factor [Sphingomonas panni]|uniref:ArsR/SmtB family transcription factor n=1 Tax=Sphingomonas panni TaxID=237612 RepID=UPI001F5BF829|nr:metalloregulator ArsR/SmtB family transcription factor [Sphingomonas panni]